MMLLQNHLDQIALSSAAIAELPFPPPNIFTNALLHPHDITALIRDTEAHERALFTITRQERNTFEPNASNARKSSVFGLDGNVQHLVNGYKASRRTTAVGMVLGGDFAEQIRRVGSGGGKERGEVDVDLLLKGAEKLCDVYPIQGATDKIASMRSRYEQLSASIARYEARVTKQASQLGRMNRSKEYDEEDDDEDEEVEPPTAQEQTEITVEDLRREEEEIRELEKRKRSLEDRVSGMERDLGGLLR